MTQNDPKRPQITSNDTIPPKNTKFQKNHSVMVGSLTMIAPVALVIYVGSLRLVVNYHGTIVRKNSGQTVCFHKFL